MRALFDLAGRFLLVRLNERFQPCLSQGYTLMRSARQQAAPLHSYSPAAHIQHESGRPQEQEVLDHTAVVFINSAGGRRRTGSEPEGEAKLDLFLQTNTKDCLYLRSVQRILQVRGETIPYTPYRIPCTP